MYDQIRHSYDTPESKINLRISTSLHAEINFFRFTNFFITTVLCVFCIDLDDTLVSKIEYENFTVGESYGLRIRFVQIHTKYVLNDGVVSYHIVSGQIVVILLI